MLMAVPALAEEALKAPSCIRITSSTETEATIQFTPNGGEAFEAERYYNSRWVKYKASIITSGQQHSLTVPLSKNLMNIVRVCAVSGPDRVCSSEGVYAKR
jgi:hypothetical protein